MTKHIRLTAVFTLLLSSALMAQDVQKETPAPAIEQSTTPAKKCSHMSDYCKKMMTAPKKGFHHSIEWGGIYGGPVNNVSYRMFGHTITVSYTHLRPKEGLYEVFMENFPISDTRSIFVLEFLDYFIDPPRYSICLLYTSRCV